MIEEPVVNLSESDEAELRRRPDHDLLGEARQMHGADRRGRQRLEREVAVGHGIERIGGRPVEAERFRRHLAVDREGGAGERRGAERAFVQRAAGVGEPAAVAAEHFDIGEQVMAERHRLRGLQMREARHDGLGVRQRLVDQRAAARSRICASSASIASRTQRRKSVAT
jgi:hypothetical protein